MADRREPARCVEDPAVVTLKLPARVCSGEVWPEHARGVSRRNREAVAESNNRVPLVEYATVIDLAERVGGESGGLRVRAA